MIKGIDVSYYQRITDAKAVADSGIKFAFVKATEGAQYVSPVFLEQLAELSSAGIEVGLYHFAHPEIDPHVQAIFFWNQYKKFPTTLAPVVDLEWIPKHNSWDDYTAEQRKEWAQSFLDAIESLTGKTPMIYTNASWYSQYLDTPGSKALFGKYPLWVAQYSVPFPTIPRDWDIYTYWQYSGSGIVPGISGQCDLNYFNDAL